MWIRIDPQTLIDLGNLKGTTYSDGDFKMFLENGQAGALEDVTPNQAARAATLLAVLFAKKDNPGIDEETKDTVRRLEAGATSLAEAIS